MVKKCLKMRFKRNLNVKYTLYHYILIEDNSYTNNVFYYDLTNNNDKLFFQTRLKHNAKYQYDIKLDSYLLFYLRFINWL